MITTIIIFIIILGLLVFVHEFGHFVVAKKGGMKVDEFGFGFPPRLVGFQKVGRKWNVVWTRSQHQPDEIRNQAGLALAQDSTIYSINWIPLGGFVRILGENNEHESDPRSFINRPFWPRLATLVAGVAMNVVLAWLLTSAGFIIGLPAAVDSASSISSHAVLKDVHIGIVEVAPGLPADLAGIKPGDQIIKIDGQAFGEISRVSGYVGSHAGKIIDFQIQRGSQILDFKVQSKIPTEPDQGATGIVLSDVGTLTVPWYLAFWEGAKAVGIQIANIAGGLYYLLTSRAGLSSVGGPIKIYQLTREVAGMGFIYLLQFTSFLSLNLAILNILPFPALDGGRVLFLLIEKIRGKRNNQKLEQFINTAGFVFLLLLMVVVTINDIARK